ncbi:MAG: 4-hydroxythreonine-4-phosphate dehydrogenase PdxA [Candidatus Omnitrophica bacterium]|nr:4-hydroxythreonine-4-phosphate dehydrogenase PdxA [Candidatus Omnitrophota bacterium]
MSQATSHKPKVKVGITIGVPSGIGPEVAKKALRKLKGLADFTVIGDAAVYKKAAGEKFLDLNNIDKKKFAYGKIKAEYGKAAIEYLDKALELLRKREIDCLVTAPISKEAINLAGFHYSGHTEYLSKNSGSKFTVMMLLNDKLKFSLVTRHIPLSQVSATISGRELAKVISLTNQSLKGLFGIKKPRIVVCGLNPHASDHGIIGKEEVELIAPIIGKLKPHLYAIHGPISADVAIHEAKEGKFDAIIAMYHDQALIPLKLSDRASGVNLTLGLPFIRTSPLHGTAFDIAGKNIASADSMAAAIKLSIKCALNQKNP